MTHPWDEFSKSLAEESLPRRESLRRLGAALAGAALMPFSLAIGAPKTGGQNACKTFCNRCPQSQRSQCLAACQACNYDSSRLCGTCGSYACCSGSGLACCGGACFDVFDDFYNCGGCGHICDGPGPYEDGACVDGTCLYQCVPGALRCNGICTPVGWDPNNCGACGNVCSGPNPSCYQGVCSHCTPSCPEGWCGGDGCGGVCACSAGWSCGETGWCYYDPPSDCTPDHPYYPNCCPGGSMICGGVCIDILSDPYNCGACGNVCEPGFVCSSGACWDPACQFNDC